MAQAAKRMQHATAKQVRSSAVTSSRSSSTISPTPEPKAALSPELLRSYGGGVLSLRSLCAELDSIERDLTS